MELPLHVVEHALDYVQGRAVVRAADVVVVLVDVADLEVMEEDLVVVDRAAVEDALVIVEGVILALVAQGVAVDAKEDVLDLVKGVGNPAAGALAVMDLVKDAQDAPDAEDLVLVRVHRKEKVRLVPHAIVALAVLVRVLHVHLVEDVLDQVDAEAIAMGAMLAVMGLVKLLALVIAMGAKDLVNRHAQLDAWVAVDVQADAVDVQADAVDAQDAVLDAMAHVLAHATGVVMDVVVDAKTHAQQLAQRHVLEHAKLKRLARQYRGGEDPTVDLIANGEWAYAVDTDLVTAKSVSVTRKGTEYNFNIDGLTILNQKTNLGDTAITFINEHDSLLDPSKMSANEPTIKLDSKNDWYLVPVYPTYKLKINKGKPLATFANTYYSELHFNIKV